MTKLSLYIALVLILFCSCKSKKDQTVQNTASVIETEIIVEETPSVPVEDSLMITYQRTPCFGMCAAFNLQVFKSGKAIYEGVNFTDMIGTYQSQIDASVLQRIYFVADSIGYFSFLEEYDNEKVTDLPSITTIIKNKQVRNRYKGPKSLHVLYKEMDIMIETSTWKPHSNK